MSALPWKIVRQSKKKWIKSNTKEEEEGEEAEGGIGQVEEEKEKMMVKV